LPSWCPAVGEEGIGYYLARLSPSHVVVGAEVRTLLLIAWLIGVRVMRKDKFNPNGMDMWYT